MIGYVKCFNNNDNKNNNNNNNDNNNNNNSNNNNSNINNGKKNSNLVGKKFDSELVYGDNDKYIKTKKKTYEDKINTNFQGKKLPKQNTPCQCLPLIMLVSIIFIIF